MGALKRVDETTVEMCKLHLYPKFKDNYWSFWKALQIPPSQ